MCLTSRFYGKFVRCRSQIPADRNVRLLGEVTITSEYRKIVGSEVRFTLPPDSPCPCGSKAPSNTCCLGKNGFYKPPSNTAPKGKSTGISRNKCYASSLNDCCKKISREHFISEILLKYLNQENELTVSGLPWLGDQKAIIPPSALASNILCERHNNSLSGLDAITLRLFNSLDESNAKHRKDKILFLFNGHDIERWLLKTLCGLIASKSIKFSDDINPEISKEWLEVLYGLSEFSDGEGLYICKSEGHLFSGAHGLEARAIVSNGRVSGLGLCICGYEFVLSLSGFPNRTFDGREFAYRPLELYAKGGEFEKSVFFSWNGEADLGTISTGINET